MSGRCTDAQCKPKHDPHRGDRRVSSERTLTPGTGSPSQLRPLRRTDVADGYSGHKAPCPSETNDPENAAQDPKGSHRSNPTATVIPVLIYPDVREAVPWLSAAFGFVDRVRIGENHRAQLRLGEGAVIVGDMRGDRRSPRPDEVTLGDGARRGRACPL